MKNKIIARILSLTGTIVIVGCLVGCSDMFVDPTKDKDSGESISLLVLDPNFIKNKIAVRFVDMNTNQPINTEQITVNFYGDDAANLVTFAGDKKQEFKTKSSIIEVGYDPNITVDATNPIELTVVAESENYISAPQFISYTTGGIKNLIVKMVGLGSFKTTTIDPYSEPFDISFLTVLHSADLLARRDIHTLPTGTAFEYQYLYRANKEGRLLCNNVKDVSLYPDYGAYYIDGTANSRAVPPAVPARDVSLSKYSNVYSTILRSGQAKCSEGLTIRVSRPEGGEGSGVYSYRLTLSDGKVLDGRITVAFPSSDNLIEPIYYPSSNPAVKVELFGDAQFDMSGAVNLASPCGQIASFTASVKSNLQTFKFITQYSCPDLIVSMGLSISGEFRKDGDTGDWTGFSFVEGVCMVQLEPGANYDFQVNLDGENYTYLLPTDLEKLQEAITNNQNNLYKIKQMNGSKTEVMTTIFVEVQFGQGICDILN
jgi:hypothetical protein